MAELNHFASIRRDYGALNLNEVQMARDPIVQFSVWFEEILQQAPSDDPTAMVLSTADEKGCPDSRVVLLKGILNGSFLFYTNYLSTKAHQIHINPQVALNFYWPQMSRQVRIRGQTEKVSALQSDQYFASRPLKSQISAIISPQSQIIPNRAVLEEEFAKCVEFSAHAPVKRPQDWGGYAVTPFEMEFWQGRDNRLHDRIRYHLENKKWILHRLAP